MSHVPTLEETVQAAVQLLRDIAQQNVNEEYRKRGDAILVNDWHRRHARDGKHPIAGETDEEYLAHLLDPQRGGRGYHPVTGETVEQYEERKSAAPAGGKKEAPKS